MERRKIVYAGMSYEVLKLNENDRWNRQGKRKSLKAISDMVSKNGYFFEVSLEIIRDIDSYRFDQKRNGKRHLEGIAHQK